MCYVIMNLACLEECGSFFLSCDCLSQKGGDIMLDLFDLLLLAIELTSLILQFKEHKNNNRTVNVVVIIITKND